MAPKKRSKNDAGSSSSRQTFDERLFANARAFERYQDLSTKPVVQDRGMECNKDPYRHDPNYDEIRRTIITNGWQQFVNVPDETNTSLMLEFLANWPEKDSQNRVYVRGKKIQVTAAIINMIYGVPDFEDSQEQLLEDERRGMNWNTFSDTLGFPGYYIPDNHIML